MSRIIKTQNNATNRNKVLKLITEAIFDYENNIDNKLDNAAYIVFLLDEIVQSIESTSAAWEKRGYWLKADRFRQEWEWARVTRDELTKALSEENIRQIGEILNGIKGRIPPEYQLNVSHRKGDVQGCWEKFKEKNPQ